MVTVKLCLNYAGNATVGDWLKAVEELQQLDARLAFANGYIKRASERLVRVSALSMRPSPKLLLGITASGKQMNRTTDRGAVMQMPSLKNTVTTEEWQLRCDLAACYRLVALYGWSDLVFTHISARLPGANHHFLINPYGMLFEEITASSLIAIDQEGNKLSDSPFQVNRAGFVIHSAIHAARHDAHCVLHTHTRAGVAVSAQQAGVLPISQQSTFVLSSLAYHDYEGVALHDEEKPSLQADLGHANFLVLRNHGLLTVGPSIADAFLSMYILETTCQIQLAAQAGGELTSVAPAILDTVAEASRTQTEGAGGAFVWPALLRKLNRMDSTYDS